MATTWHQSNVFVELLTRFMRLLVHRTTKLNTARNFLLTREDRVYTTSCGYVDTRSIKYSGHKRQKMTGQLLSAAEPN